MRLDCQYLPVTNSSLLQNTVTVLWHWSLLALVFTVFTGQRERRGGRKIEKEGGNLSWIVIFHERSIRNRHKNLFPPPVYGWMGACVCLSVCLNVCLSVVLSVCLSALCKNVNNFWRNERMFLKFSGLVQSLRSNFWAGKWISRPQGYCLGSKKAWFLN